MRKKAEKEDELRRAEEAKKAKMAEDREKWKADQL